jgi:hypothetical protein
VPHQSARRQGCGESGRSAAALRHQWRDGRLSELGIKQLNTPLTPAKVWQAIRDAKAGVVAPTGVIPGRRSAIRNPSRRLPGEMLRSSAQGR